MKLTIITVCFNSEKTIEHTIKSVISQNYLNYEYIIIDGESTDNTKNIIEKYNDHISFFLSEKDKGIYDAINKGIKKSTGDVVAILHADDIFFENETTQTVMNHFKSNLDLDCLIGNTIITHNNSRKIMRKYSGNFFKKWMLYFGFSPPHPSTFIKKDIYDKCGLYSNKYKIAGDFDFFIRLFLKTKITCKLVNENYVLMRSGGKSSISIKSNFISSKEIIESLRKNNLYSSWFLIILRFPFKLIQFIIK
tara:strand:- start:882 stop:1631 length:750 start_codon:yes stop_codon:yes gene_type:complete